MLSLVELLTPVYRSLPWKTLLVLLSCTAGIVTLRPAQAQTFSVLQSFGGADGSRPYAGITLDPPEENLWGVTAYGGVLNCDAGGPAGCGVIFRLTREDSTWNFSVPYVFPGSDNGFLPVYPSQITIGPNNTPYGAELEGGSLLAGTVYSLLPPVISALNTPWTHTVLHQFGNGEDGAYPHKIIFDQAGNIFGATTYGGTFNNGTIYELSPSSDGWTENILYNFVGGPDGQRPSDVVFDDDGNLYGVTEQGGGGNEGCFPFSGCGTIFELKRSGSGWTKTVLHAFQQDTEGGDPGPLMRDNSGNLFGLTAQNGPDNFGTIWELSPSDGGWIFTVLYSFTEQTVAIGGPFAPIMDASGALYGFNNNGGANLCETGGERCGSIYKLTPSNSGWIYTDVHDFALNDDGCLPVGPPAIDAVGNLYGVTYGCGAGGGGVAFKFTP